MHSAAPSNNNDDQIPSGYYDKNKVSDTCQTWLELEEYIDEAGQCGIYQIRMQFIFFFMMMVLASQVFVAYFASHDPPWRCARTSTFCNYTNEFSQELHQERFHLRCTMRRDDWEYTKQRDYSIVTQVWT